MQYIDLCLEFPIPKPIFNIDLNSINLNFYIHFRILIHIYSVKQWVYSFFQVVHLIFHCVQVEPLISFHICIYFASIYQNKEMILLC